MATKRAKPLTPFAKWLLGEIEQRNLSARAASMGAGVNSNAGAELAPHSSLLTITFVNLFQQAENSWSNLLTL